jgi:aldehyde:ferredoxin oxidoreductase
MNIKDAKILRVNLSTKNISLEALDLNKVKMFLGGRGLGSKILSDEVDPKVDPLSEQNKLILTNGLLTGLSGPTTGRYMVITKSPLTGLIASSNSGGFFGRELRKAGYMAVIVEGKAANPVYISIKDDDVEIKDASKLWGLKVGETTEKALEDFGESNGRVCCIGPAGENLSKIASVMNDKDRAAGRSGVGAVMGSKNLKAIVVKGSGTVEPESKELFREAVKAKNDILKQHAVTGEGLPALGTKVLDNIINGGGLYPTNNFQKCTFDKVDEVSGEALVEKKYLKKNKACFSCPIACGRLTELPDGSKGEGPEYESGWCFGAACGISDLIAVTKANFMCNHLGLDTISAGVTISTAMELYEKGYIPKEDLENGPEPVFGSSESLLFYIQKMGLREGKLGNRLAEGAYRLAESYGHPELAMTVKKQELPAYDPRGVQGLGLQYATTNRGGCHVRGYLISSEVLGIPEKLDPQELESKPMWVKAYQDATAVIDSSGTCLFTWFAFANADHYRDLINSATGFDLTTDEVMQIGERIWNLERQFNQKAGLEADMLPERFLNEPIPDGPQKGALSKVKELLPKYYQLRGWDANGNIPEEKLKELSL